MVPLWAHADTGWFAYDCGGRLAYMNPAMLRILGRRPAIGSTEFAIEVVPEARRAVHRAFSAMCCGAIDHLDTVLPALVRGEPRPIHVVLARIVAADGGTSVVGTVRPIIHSSDSTTTDHQQLLAIEQVLGRVLAELTAVADELPAETADSTALVPGLSVRQSEVLEWLARGECASAIAERLNLSPHTVRNHTKAIFKAMGVHSQAELVTHYRSRLAHPSRR